MKSKTILPNCLTLLNLLFGCVAIVFIFWHVFSGAIICLLLSALFDLLDGYIARRKNIQSSLGKSLDALADMVSFGITPALLLNVLYLSERLSSSNVAFDIFGLSVEFAWLPLSIFPFLVTLCIAFRLAKFGSSESQKQSFIGLPSPALALLIVPLPLLFEHPHFGVFSQLLESTLPIIVISIIACFLVLMPLKMFKLKLTFNRSQSKGEWGLYLISLVLLFFYQLLAIPLIVLSYIIINIVNNLVHGTKSAQ